jgi:hypothetical protein
MADEAAGMDESGARGVGGVRGKSMAIRLRACCSTNAKDALRLFALVWAA